jgi:lipoprotein-releasing system ATP-binding protein
MMPGLIAGKSRSACTERAHTLLDRLSVLPRQGHKPAQLSGGEQQRVAVARALFNAPSVVLADEPSGNLDSAHARELHQLFFDLRKEGGQTFVIVTHNEELASMADRKLTMRDGRMN